MTAISKSTLFKRSKSTSGFFSSSLFPIFSSFFNLSIFFFRFFLSSYILSFFDLSTLLYVFPSFIFYLSFLLLIHQSIFYLSEYAFSVFYLSKYAFSIHIFTYFSMRQLRLSYSMEFHRFLSNWNGFLNSSVFIVLLLGKRWNIGGILPCFFLKVVLLMVIRKSV